MRALVTGGAGFIGSHLAEALSHGGVEVRILDNFQLGSPENLQWIRPNSSVTVLAGDLRDVTLVRTALEGCDWVFHLAALPSVPRSVEHPLESHAINLEGTLQLLQAAREGQVGRVVFASSSAIYGESSAPTKQESLAPSPLSPYALQKYAAERYGQLFHDFYGLDTVSLRYFNVFGPRQSHSSPYSGVIARFCTAAISGNRPTIFGDGTQSRDFTYVDNVVAANLAVAAAPRERVGGKVFNIAAGESISLLRLIDHLSELTGRRIDPLFAPPRPGDILYSKADIQLAHNAFGYHPSVGWEDGLEKTLAWYRTKSV
jgi:UDP-glucose 4-epimerase